ncbi:MAG: hypothetical protein IJ272_05655 [Clostridia bacterium]|nr:hypothetical protein [Clostridia bacterium]
MRRNSSRKKSNKKRYVEYDYESTFSSNSNMLNEWMIEYMLKTNKVRSTYATKEYRLQKQLEIEIYPEFTRKEIEEDKSIKKANKKAQKNLNDKNSRKQLIRLINKNFTDGDLWMTVTYDAKYLPSSMEEALKNMQNYIRRINYRLKKKGLEKAKYVYVSEYNEKHSVRYHHHIVMRCGLTMDELESLWKFGGRNETRRIRTDEYGIVGLAKYVSKAKKNCKHEKRWCSSNNLEKVTFRKNHYKFKKKKVEEMIRDNNLIKHYMETTYKDYYLLDADVYFNEVNGRWYISAHMRRRD